MLVVLLREHSYALDILHPLVNAGLVWHGQEIIR
jgi:hypothetical protein